MSEAIINHVRLGAAHDGDAELVVTLMFENGGVTEVTLEHFAARHLMDACAVTRPEALIGQSWRSVRDALAAASNRFVKTETSKQG
jgi:hypothetical protein